MALGLNPFTGKAAAAYGAPVARINLWDGSVRSGKTLNSLMKWTRWLRAGAPPGSLMLVSKTERTAKQNIVDPLYDILGPKFIRYSAGNHEVTIAGRRHLIVGASDMRAEGKIRGITLAGMYGDEVTLWPESFFAMALSRLSLPGAAFFGTTNPDAPGHWLKRRYLNHAAELEIAHHHFVLADNPNLSPGFVESIMREYRGLWRKRLVEGLWAVAEGAIFDALGDHLLVPDLPATDWTFAGIESGTSNPTVFVALSGAADRLVAHHEWRWDAQERGRQKTMKELSIDFAAWRDALPQAPDKVYVKPEANALILQMWRDGQRGIHPADDDTTNGIMETAALIGAERLQFHRPTIDTGWEEMASYAWDPKASERGEDKPLATMDSYPDALRFAVRGSRNRWRHLLATAESPR